MKKAILTGHSKGLGAALTEALLGAGFEVLGLSRSPLGRSDAGFTEVALDLSDAAAVQGFADSKVLVDFLAGADQALLINNAGIVDPIAPAGRQDAASIVRAVTVNVTGPLLLTNGFVAATRSVTDRRVVHISSGAGRNAYTGWSVYCATKAAVDHHLRAIAEDGLAGLRVESIAPGVIDTDMQATIRSTPKADFALVDQFHEMKSGGALATAEATAAKICAHVLSDSFGQEICTDVRTF